MSALVKHTNKDGLPLRFGVETESERRVRYAVGKVEEELVVDFKYSDVTADAGVGFYDWDSGGGDTPDSFSEAVPFIPANSIITAAYLVATVAWTGTSTPAMDVGLFTKGTTATASAAQDINGIFAAVDVDSTTAGLGAVGNAVLANGVCVHQTTATYDEDAISAIDANMYVRPTIQAGAFTAGEARLVVKYIAI